MYFYILKYIDKHTYFLLSFKIFAPLYPWAFLSILFFTSLILHMFFFCLLKVMELYDQWPTKIIYLLQIQKICFVLLGNYKSKTFSFLEHTMAFVCVCVCECLCMCWCHMTEQGFELHIFPLYPKIFRLPTTK